VDYAVAHFALQKLHILPSVLENLPRNERIFIYASIMARIESEKEAEEEIKRKASKGRR